MSAADPSAEAAFWKEQKWKKAGASLSGKTDQADQGKGEWYSPVKHLLKGDMLCGS